MRLTVGPLPASVYWRRRAIVVGGLILAASMIFYSCKVAGQPSSTSSTPTGKPETTGSPAAEPSATATGQLVGAALTATPSADVAAATTPPAGDPSLCTDQEMLITPVPAKTSLPQGTAVLITLLIKNKSDRTCNRDVGADLQELRIVLGTEKIWSSDDCDGPTGNELRSFPPGHERSYQVIWNGHSSSSCSPTQKRTPTGQIPDRGEYQLVGRVGTANGSVTLKIT